MALLKRSRGPDDSDYLTQRPMQKKRNIRNAKSLLSYSDYTVGWICALPIEMAAAKAMLDHTHCSLSSSLSDSNTYILGNIGSHNIVIACLPSGQYGTNNAATVANNMCRTFRCIQFSLMVGVGGGVPAKVDMRLGDVVVSKNVIQYDLGKTIQGGQFERLGVLTKPPQILLTAVSKLQAAHELSPTQIPTLLSSMLKKYPSMSGYTYPAASRDILFKSQYDHESSSKNCDHCNSSKMVKRSERNTKNPKIHYGIIASGNQVIKHGSTRDRLARGLDNICFEMEAAGLMDHFPCLIIRGICDYSDSHKNKEWQRYAAATAAAYARELLSVIPPRMDTIRLGALSKSLNFGTRIYEKEWHKENENARETRGGDARGGDAQGGAAQGGAVRGGDARGGDARGGDARGGNTRGGDARGGDAQGGNARGGNARGGNARGGDAWG